MNWNPKKYANNCFTNSNTNRCLKCIQCGRIRSLRCRRTQPLYIQQNLSHIRFIPNVYFIWNFWIFELKVHTNWNAKHLFKIVICVYIHSKGIFYYYIEWGSNFVVSVFISSARFDFDKFWVKLIVSLSEYPSIHPLVKMFVNYFEFTLPSKSIEYDVSRRYIGYFGLNLISLSAFSVPPTASS